MNVGKLNNIKIFYGVEGYLVEDDFFIIEDVNDKEFLQIFVVFDIEIIGFFNINDKIIEIGVVKIENFKIVDRFSELINFEKDIFYKIQELIGIINELIKDKLIIEEVFFKFMEFVGDSVLVVYNVEFDIGFIL